MSLGLGSLDSNVFPLDAFELDTTDADNPVLRLRSGWKMQYISELLAAIEMITTQTGLKPSTSLYPSTMLYPYGTLTIG